MLLDVVIAIKNSNFKHSPANRFPLNLDELGINYNFSNKNKFESSIMGNLLKRDSIKAHGNFFMHNACSIAGLLRINLAVPPKYFLGLPEELNSSKSVRGYRVFWFGINYTMGLPTPSRMGQNQVSVAPVWLDWGLKWANIPKATRRHSPAAAAVAPTQPVGTSGPGTTPA